MLVTEFADVALAAVVLGTVGGTIVSVTKLWLRRAELRERPRLMADAVDERLQRIEQAVDAIAIEVERMSESQRFTSRVLAERLPPGETPTGAPRA
jgi:hypothetical protein